MKKTTIIPTVSVLIALVCAARLFFHWNPEPLLKGKEQPVTLSDIEQNLSEDFNASPAGADIPILTSTEDFSEIVCDTHYYATAEPVGIVQTGVSGLKPWKSPDFTYRAGRITGRTDRLDDVVPSDFDPFGFYLPYYLLELPDHTYMLAQIPQKSAKAIENRESITLPISRKVRMTNAARNELSAICEEYGADMDGVFYIFNTKWQEEHQLISVLIRFGAAALLWLVLTIGLINAGWKIFRCEET